jgi:predicted HTH domain antitoxin
MVPGFDLINWIDLPVHRTMLPDKLLELRLELRIPLFAFGRDSVTTMTEDGMRLGKQAELTRDRGIGPACVWGAERYERGG